MQLISVNVGIEKPLQGKETGSSGIFKIPTQDAVKITHDGLEKDVIIDVKHHGGVDQAVYVYGVPDYDWWSAELGHELEAGLFGENLTISGLESATFNIGDTLRVGEVLLQVTAGRVPCATLAARMGDPQFVKRFRAAERPGLYCRVIETGSVRVGDAVTVEAYQGETLTLIEMYRLFFEGKMSEANVLRMLASPIAIRDRKDAEARLAEIQAQKLLS